MDALWIAIAVGVVVAGLVASARGRGGTRSADVLGGLGFRRDGDAWRSAWPDGDQRRELVVEPVATTLGLSLPLAPAPIPHEVLARALGRGDLLAALHDLGASASEARLAAKLDTDASAKQLRRHIERALRLARDLEALPRAEGMARWYLDLAQGSDLAQALRRVIDADPRAPETLAACRMERDHPRDLRAAALAREHLERAAL